MKMTLIVFLFLCFLLQSCDPVYRVVLRNQSGHDKTISVFYPKYKYEAHDDTIPLKQGFLYPSTIPITSKDSALRTYTFILNPNIDATIGIEGIALRDYPMFNQSIVINNHDTVYLSRKNLAHKFMSFKWVYSIKY